MSTLKFLAGLGGASVLTILHETMRMTKPTDNLPRIDLVGKEALQKTATELGHPIKSEKNLYADSLVGDLLANAAYFSTIATSNENLFPRAVSLGLTAGIGAISIPDKIGLDSKPVTKTTKTKVLTVGYYIAGALATALIFKAMQKTK